MPTVTLGRLWNPGYKQYCQGDKVEVSDNVAAWLQRTGALAVEPAKVMVNTTPTAVDEPDVEEDSPVVDSPVKLPPKSASVDMWRETADKLGLVTKGLSKQELIAVVHESTNPVTSA